MYRTDELPKINDGSLYHFTTRESLIKIIESMTLKLSSFKNLNDLNERELNCNNTDSFLKLKHKRYIVEHCKLLSFSRNYKFGKLIYKGYNHPRMWAQYADNNSGACIEINKDQFIEKNQSLLKNKFYKIKNVSYNKQLYNKEINTSLYSDTESFLKEHYKHIFFKKYIDWKHEHEIRFWGIDLLSEYLSIDGCIDCIYLGRNFGKDHMLRIIEILVESISKREHEQILTPGDFALQINSDGRITASPYEFTILKNLNTLSERINHYMRYLEEVGYEDLDRYL